MSEREEAIRRIGYLAGTTRSSEMHNTASLGEQRELYSISEIRGLLSIAEKAEEKPINPDSRDNTLPLFEKTYSPPTQERFSY